MCINLRRRWPKYNLYNLCLKHYPDGSAETEFMCPAGCGIGTEHCREFRVRYLQPMTLWVLALLNRRRVDPISDAIDTFGIWLIIVFFRKYKVIELRDVVYLKFTYIKFQRIVCF